MRFLFFTVIFIIIFCARINAFELGISPAQVVFEGSQNKTICKEVHVFSTQESAYYVYNEWSTKASRNIYDYTLDAENFGLVISYPDIIQVGQKDIRVCITAECSGFYQGVLLVQPIERSIGVGAWLLVNINGNACLQENKNIINLAGNTILRQDEKNNVWKSAELLSLVLFEVSFFAGIFLLFLAIHNQNREIALT